MNDLKIKDLYKLFTQQGYNVVIGDIYKQQQKWLNWYRGEVNDFHYFSVKTINGATIGKHKPSLNMAKKVAEDWASLLFNEKVELTVSNQKAQERINEVLLDNNFVDEMTNFVELSMVYGTGVTVEYIAENEVKLNFIYGDKIMPIGYENSTITEIAVIQEFEQNKKRYTHVMYHTYRYHKTGIDGNGNPTYAKDKAYRVTHEMYSTKSGSGLGKPDSLSVLFDKQELNRMRHKVKVTDSESVTVYYLEYESEPHFQIFKPAITNNFEVKSPMGVSAFANAISVLSGADDKYYSFVNDSILSRKKIFLDDEATKLQKTKVTNPDGSTSVQYVKYFDQDETIFQTLKMGRDGEGKSIEIYAPDYQAQPHIDGINHDLNLLSFKCGLGTNYYSFEDGAVGYQNELNVIASNSDTFRNRQKHLNRLGQVLINMMKTTLYLSKDLGEYSGDLDLDYNVMFDDTIITDDNTKIMQMRADGTDGIIPMYLYIMEQYKVNEEEARKIEAEAEAKRANMFDVEVEDEETLEDE